MFEPLTSFITLIIFINYLFLSLFIFKEIGLYGILIITILFYLFILISTIIIIEIIGMRGYLLL
jgi:hypothetical protein